LEIGEIVHYLLDKKQFMDVGFCQFYARML